MESVLLGGLGSALGTGGLGGALEYAKTWWQSYGNLMHQQDKQNLQFQ